MATVRELLIRVGFDVDSNRLQAINASVNNFANGAVRRANSLVQALSTRLRGLAAAFPRFLVHLMSEFNRRVENIIVNAPLLARNFIKLAVIIKGITSEMEKGEVTGLRFAKIMGQAVIGFGTFRQTRKLIHGTRTEMQQMIPPIHQARQGFVQMQPAVAGVGRTASAMGGQIMAALGPILSIFGLIQGIKGILGVNVEFQKLEARLVTVEGSTEGAKKKFEELNALARQTPFQVDELTDSYARLKAAGFEVGDAEMMALGNLATASGKGMNDITEAMISTNRGMASMIDNFVGLQGKVGKGGITALDEQRKGQKFVLKNQEDILKFFTGAGGGKFDDAMTNQMATLGGAISNAKGAIKDFVKTVGDSGFNAAVGEFMKVIFGPDSQKGAKSMAVLLGRTLGFAVRRLADLMSFLKENSTAVIAIFGTLAGAFIIGQFFALANAVTAGAVALRTMTLAALPLQVKLLAVGAVLLGIFLLFDDLIAFAEGRPSILGDALDANPGSEFLQFLATFAVAFNNFLGELMRFPEIWDEAMMFAEEDFKEFALGVDETVREIIGFIMNIPQAARDMAKEMFTAIKDVPLLGKAAEFAADNLGDIAGGVVSGFIPGGAAIRAQQQAQNAANRSRTKVNAPVNVQVTTGATDPVLVGREVARATGAEIRNSYADLDGAPD